MFIRRISPTLAKISATNTKPITIFVRNFIFSNMRFSSRSRAPFLKGLDRQLKGPFEIEDVHQFVLELVGSSNQLAGGSLQRFRPIRKGLWIHLYDFSYPIDQQARKTLASISNVV